MPAHRPRQREPVTCVLAHACVALCACIGALESAAAAVADGTNPSYPGSVLHVSVRGRMVVGQEAQITATGTNASQGGLGFGSFGLVLFAVDRDALPVACFNSENAEATLYENNDRYVNDLTFRALDEGTQGAFSISTGVPLTSPGHWQVCAYSTLVTDTAAWASAEVTIAPARAARPVVTARPRVTRAGGVLRCARGSWSGHPVAYAYHWLVVHRPGVAGHGQTLAVTRSLRGRTVACSVTATNAGGSTSATSAGFKVV
jgi:hypothetical protein